MKIFVLLIQFISLNIFTYSQTDSLQSSSLILVNNLDSNFVEKYEPVSTAGAATLSLIFPGSGLFLSENYGAAAAYLGVGSAFYVTGLIFLLSGESPNEDVALPLFIAGGVVHLASIVHTIIATEEYNESLVPIISYNGKVYQIGLIVKF